MYGESFIGQENLPDVNDHNLPEVYKAYKVDALEQYPAAEMPIIWD